MNSMDLLPSAEQHPAPREPIPPPSQGQIRPFAWGLFLRPNFEIHKHFKIKDYFMRYTRFAPENAHRNHQHHSLSLSPLFARQIELEKERKDAQIAKTRITGVKCTVCL
jgi:hypothetical protein